MNKIHVKPSAALYAFACAALLLFSCAAQTRAQNSDDDDAPAAQETDAAQEASRRPRPQRRDDAKGELLTRLNLTPEQREQVRLIRQQTETETRALVPRIRQARRALDRAIYLEDADESVIETRVRELAAAQAEALRLRTSAELKVRRVLTPEQLEILRGLRRQGFNRQMRMRQRGGDASGAPSDGRRRRMRTPASANVNETGAPGETPNSAPDFNARPRRRRDGALRRPRP